MNPEKYPRWSEVQKTDKTNTALRELLKNIERDNNTTKTQNNISDLFKEVNNKEKTIKITDTMKYFNYSFKNLEKNHKRFRWPSWKIEYKYFTWENRLKIFKYINKYMWFLSPKEKERFVNTLFFESVYWRYTYNKNNNWTIDLWPCMINNWTTYKELKKAWVIQNKESLKNWDTNFKAAAWIMKKYWIKRWYWRVEAKKAKLA